MGEEAVDRARAAESARSVLLTRRPIWDMAGVVRGYDVIGDPSEPGGADRDSHCRRIIHALVNVIGIEVIATPETRLFVHTERSVVLERQYLALLPPRVVLVVSAAGATECFLRELVHARRIGYELAVNYDESDGLVEAGFIRANLRSPGRVMLGAAQTKGQRAIALGIDDRNDWEHARAAGFDLCSGEGLCAPDIAEGREVAGISSSHARLMQQLQDQVLDRPSITRIVESDVGLSHGLLRRANSAAHGVRQTVSSIPHAIALLGDDQVRAWGCLTVLSGLKGSKPSELIRSSLVAARFCSRIAAAGRAADLAARAYLVGLLSKLDAILGLPMERCLAPLGLSDEIAAPLLGSRDTPLAMILNLCRACERGAWSTVLDTRVRLGLTQPTVAQEYYDSMANAQRFLGSSA